MAKRTAADVTGPTSDNAPETTALALVKDVGTFEILTMPVNQLPELMKENAGAEGITPFDLDRIAIPAGGGKAWEVPTLEGTEAVGVVQGVVIAWNNARAYFDQPFEETGGGVPPACSSNDGITGVGNPGGQCEKCPMAQFGTARGGKGKGQACRAIRRLFIIRPGDRLPMVIALPPTSLKAAKKYFLRLASQGIPFYGVVTKFGLEQKNDPVKHSVALFAVASRLDPQQVEAFRKISEGLKPYLVKQPVVDGDFRVVGGESEDDNIPI